MKKILLNIKYLLIPAIFFSSSHVLAMNCTIDQINQLKKDGWKVEEIKQLCRNGSSGINQNNQSSQQPAQTLGQKCQTQFGVCGLYHLPPTPVGTPCFCINKYNGLKDSGYIIQ